MSPISFPLLNYRSPSPPPELSAEKEIEEEMASFLDQAKKMPPKHKEHFEQILRNLFKTALSSLERPDPKSLQKRLIEAKRVFSQEAQKALTISKEEIAIQKMSKIGQNATGREYIEAFGRGSMNGLSALLEDLMHPIDRIAMPLAQFLHETGMANAHFAPGHLEAPIGYAEIARRDPSEHKMASLAQEQRINGVVEKFKDFINGSGPQKVEVIASIFTPSVALGFAGHVGQSIRASRHANSLPRNNYQYSAIKFDTSEGGKGYARLSTSLEEKVFKVHLDLLETEYHPIGGSTPPAGVFPTMIKICQQLAKDAGAEKLLIQGFFVNEKLLNVFHQGYPYQGFQPFFHKNLKGPSSMLWQDIFDRKYQEFLFHTYEIPLGKRMPVSNPPLPFEGFPAI